jgi:hypothetical protein
MEQQTERHKAMNEYLRFMTTLSTGSLVLLTSFLEKIASQPELGVWIRNAFTGFTICVVACVVAYSVTTLNFGSNIAGSKGTVVGIAVYIAWISFIFAIIALMKFGWAYF